MSSFSPRTRYVCQHCVQQLGRHRAGSSSGQHRPQFEHATPRSNGLTRDGMRFRKLEVQTQSRWHSSNIFVGKPPSFVPVGELPEAQKLQTNPVEHAPRRTGRIRAGRARIPGPQAAKYLQERDQSFQELIPSAPSSSLGSMTTTSTKYVQAKPMLAAPQDDPLRPSTHNLYWETLPPKDKDLQRANQFFQKNRNPPKFLLSAARFMEVPESDVPEVAFVGRSNVGKSSLLNAVVGADVKSLLARTSATRGFTKTMNFYGIGPDAGVFLKKSKNGRNKFTGSGLVLVDMPGYGQGSIGSWGVEIMKYFQSRKELRRVFVLLDVEHGIKDKDRSLLASLRLAGVSHQVILSKMDKLYIPESKSAMTNKRHMTKAKGSLEALHETMETMRPEFQPPIGGGAVGEILACSSEAWTDGAKLGIDHVRYAILKAVGLQDRQTLVRRLSEKNSEKALPKREAKNHVAHDVSPLLRRL